MNPPRLVFFAASVSLGLLAGAAPSQSTLSLDGRTSVIKLMGSSMAITVTGGAGQLAALLIDVDDGPSVLFGESVPIGLTPFLSVLPLGALPGTGALTFAVPLPSSPAIHNAFLYFMAVVVDPSSSSGLDFSNGANVQIVDRRIELAGNRLAQYPHFEYVRAINRGATVEMAVDPSRHPFLAGDTADVYVVAAKTRSQWIANPALVDVRPSGAQTVTFSGASIQANTFTLDNGAGTLAGPDETGLSGDTRIGIAYDVVIDRDQDGRFDSNADLIDGYDERNAGFYVVRDTAAGSTKVNPSAGPYRVIEILYSGGTFLGQDTYYPANIASLGRLPLVVVSHGNGHDYQWYDHIGYHLASYGYLVMSHQNNTQPGSHTAALSTLANTEYILGNQATIGGGVLNGHIDGNRIVWIGHSRGADGVARAYDRLFTGMTVPVNFSKAGVKLVSSIAPVDFGGFAGAAPSLGGTGVGSNPRDVPFYHLWVAQADADVIGCPILGSDGLWYHLHERATRARMSTSLYGVGHGDYHDGGGSSVALGPNLIGRAATHAIMLGYLLPLVRHSVQDDVPSRDFLTRQYESFHAIGSPTGPIYVANLMFQDDPASSYAIDNFQDIRVSGPTPAVASSGAAVTRTVRDYLENRHVDAEGGFEWSTQDPFNGFVMDDRMNAFRSNSFGSVFSVDGLGEDHITYDMTTAANRPRFSDYQFLSFRAAQGTRHPLTISSLGDDTFAVTLEDGAGHRSSVNVGAYGGGIEEPYQRTGCQTFAGTGWNSEFETIRIRLTDFLNNGNAVDLTDVEKVIFQFGPSHGSAQARLGLDEIELTKQ